MLIIQLIIISMETEFAELQIQKICYISKMVISKLMNNDRLPPNEYDNRGYKDTIISA